MKPAPTTTAERAAVMAVRSASASASVRSSWTPGRSAPGTGSPRLTAPVARTSAVYLLRTLETHELVERDTAGRYWLGVGVSALARSVRSDLQAAALPRLEVLAEDLGMTAFLVVRVGGEAVTVASAEPHDTAAPAVYRPRT